MRPVVIDAGTMKSHDLMTSNKDDYFSFLWKVSIV